MQLCGSAPLHSIWWSIKPFTHFKKSWSSHTDTYTQTQAGTHMVVGCLMEVWWCFQGHFAEREWVRWGGIAESVRELTQRVHDYFSMFLCGHVFLSWWGPKFCTGIAHSAEGKGFLQNCSLKGQNSFFWLQRLGLHSVVCIELISCIHKYVNLMTREVRHVCVCYWSLCKLHANHPT